MLVSRSQSKDSIFGYFPSDALLFITRLIHHSQRSSTACGGGAASGASSFCALSGSVLFRNPRVRAGLLLSESLTGGRSVDAPSKTVAGGNRTASVPARRDVCIQRPSGQYSLFQMNFSMSLYKRRWTAQLYSFASLCTLMTLLPSLDRSQASDVDTPTPRRNGTSPRPCRQFSALRTAHGVSIPAFLVGNPVDMQRNERKAEEP